jgi:hypothetical protein
MTWSTTWGVTAMNNLGECQIPSLPRFAEGRADVGPQPLDKRLKRVLAKPWNYHVKKCVKQYFGLLHEWTSRFSDKDSIPSAQKQGSSAVGLRAGDWVRVRSREEILSTLDRWKETKGCGFLDYMWQYCGTVQRVLQPMERFLDERDYKVKKCKGIVLLESVICHGTPVFGKCDRCCHLFWREEWLEKVEKKPARTISLLF